MLDYIYNSTHISYVRKDNLGEQGDLIKEPEETRCKGVWKLLYNMA